MGTLGLSKQQDNYFTVVPHPIKQSTLNTVYFYTYGVLNPLNRVINQPSQLKTNYVTMYLYLNGLRDPQAYS